jgi:hypothetical protein
MLFDHALLTDVSGKPIRQHHKIFSTDWDEISDWSDRVYMPYRVFPIGHAIKPRATMHSSRIGELTLTRFAYGVAVSVDEFSPEAGNASASIPLIRLQPRSSRPWPWIFCAPLDRAGWTP